MDIRTEEGRENETQLTDYLQEVSLLTDLDSNEGADVPRVVLMTIHSAKGLEFPTVFVVGLEENIFPSPLCIDSKRELEEERRLLYVAITRAERHCILTCAKNRWRYGKMEFDTPSRFIYDIDPNLLKVENEMETEGGGFFNPYTGRKSQGYQNSRPVATQFRADPKPRIVSHRTEQPADPFSPSFKRTFTAAGGNLKRVSDVVSKSANVSNTASSGKSLLNEGNVIEHERFGIGKVVKVEGTGENTKATVEFRNTGTKQLLLKFARYKIIS